MAEAKDLKSFQRGFESLLPYPSPFFAPSMTKTTSHPESLILLRPDTGEEFKLALTDGSIRAADLQQVLLGKDLPWILSYDPGFINTASCRSDITFINGDAGILSYRGYPVEQLAGVYNFEDICLLLWDGELPTSEQAEVFHQELSNEAILSADMVELFAAFPNGAHPMTMMTAALAVLGSKYPDSSDVLDPKNRRRQMIRLLAKTPALAALAYRRFVGLPVVGPRPELGYTGSFLRMLLGKPGEDYEMSQTVQRAIDALLTLHADHEQNCSTSAVRNVGSSQTNPYSSVAAGCAALHGPLHGGANQAVLEMLNEIGTVDNVTNFLDSCKAGDRRLMGFGHRVYKNYDPRAKVIRGLCHDILSTIKDDPRLNIAQALEEAALADDYFISRKLFPNVDFYSGLIYSALGFPPEMFTVFFMVGRMPGWLAHWNEMLEDPEQRIVRPRQLYGGPALRDVPTASERR